VPESLSIQPECTNTYRGKDYTFTLYLLGDRVVLSKTYGHATAFDIEQAIELNEKFLAETIPEGSTYIRIEDLSNLKGATREARRNFINYIRENERIQGLIFYGASSLFKLSIKLGKRLYRPKFDVELVNTYSDAIKLAEKVLLNSGNAHIDSLPHIQPDHSSFHHKNGVEYKINADPDWQIQVRDFSFRCEIIEDEVLHVVSTGKFTEENVDPCFTVMKNAARSLSFSTHPCYLVLCLQKTKGTKQKARMGYFKAAKQFYKSYPVKMTILYGVNRFLKAALNVNKSFLPMKISVANQLEDALALTNKDRLGSKGPMLEHIEKNSDVAFGKTDKIDQYVDELHQRYLIDD